MEKRRNGAKATMYVQHSVLEQIWTKSPYPDQRLPQHESLHPIGLKSARIEIPHIAVRILDLRVQVHPGELWVSKQLVHIVLEASKSAGAKGDVPKICGFVHPVHPL